MIYDNSTIFKVWYIIEGGNGDVQTMYFSTYDAATKFRSVIAKRSITHGMTKITEQTLDTRSWE
jgi:hypothetical protein